MAAPAAGGDASGALHARRQAAHGRGVGHLAAFLGGHRQGAWQGLVSAPGSLRFELGRQPRVAVVDVVIPHDGVQGGDTADSTAAASAGALCAVFGARPWRDEGAGPIGDGERVVHPAGAGEAAAVRRRRRGGAGDERDGLRGYQLRVGGDDDDTAAQPHHRRAFSVSWGGSPEQQQHQQGDDAVAVELVHFYGFFVSFLLASNLGHHVTSIALRSSGRHGRR